MLSCKLPASAADRRSLAKWRIASIIAFDFSRLISGKDQSGGVVILKYVKSKSDSVNIYSQRENDADFVFLIRISSLSHTDNRLLLVQGKPELRCYTAVYVVNDEEIGLFSDKWVTNAAP